MHSPVDHAIDRGDYFLVPFEELSIPIGGKRQGNSFEGAARIYRCGAIEIELGDPPLNGVDDNNRTDLVGGYHQERMLHQMLVTAYKQQFADVVVALSGLQAVA